MAPSSISGMDESAGQRVARVAVDMPLAHLDRPFDYLVPDALAADAVIGARVRVRFAGRLRGGFILDLADSSERDDLLSLHAVVSAEPVLHPEVARLVRAVADHYAGGFADVVRLAVPPRHGITEAAAPTLHPSCAPATGAVSLASYRWGPAFRSALEAGLSPRAAWTVVPNGDDVGDWVGGLVEAAAATLASGRGVLLLVPDADDLDRLSRRCDEVFGRGSHVSLSADLGPAARYRSFLAASRGAVRLVLGTRAAAFAPVAELGLIALWDDGNDAYAEPHAPYPHARDVAVLRAHLAGCGLLLAAHSRTAEVQRLVERSWLAPIQASPAEARHASARVSVAAPQTGRLPHEVFEVIRTGLAAGPVLVQVPRAGYLPVWVCRRCSETARCPGCRQPLAQWNEGDRRLSCPWCGPVTGEWRCPHCRGSGLRTPTVGVVRTAEEFGKAFPQTAVLHSAADHRVAGVDDRPTIVLATPGAEPPARFGYAAAVLLDTRAMLSRPDLRAAEEALRRWLAVTALVRSGDEGGTVLVVGEPGERAVQALVRLDPVGFAERELADRRDAGFPPAHKLVVLEGSEGTLIDALSLVGPVNGVEGIGPFPVPGGSDDQARVTLRCALREAPELLARVRTLQSVRAARKTEGIMRVRVDPQVIG